MIMNLIGPNWKTSLSAAGTAIMAALTFLSTVSYDQGPISMVIPVRYKPTVALIAGLSTLALWIYNGLQQKSKNVTGGSVQQTYEGKFVEAGKQDLVDATLESSPVQEKMTKLSDDKTKRMNGAAT